MGWIRWIRLWRRISSQISVQGIHGPLKCLIYCWTPSKGKTFLVRFSDGHCQTTPTNWCYETLENKPIKPEETRFDIARKLGPRFFNPKIPDISNLYQFENHEKLAWAKIHSADVPEAVIYREDIYDSTLSWWNTYDVRGHFSMVNYDFNILKVFRRFDRVYRCKSLE